jgi:hypothetical protein
MGSESPRRIQIGDHEFPRPLCSVLHGLVPLRVAHREEVVAQTPALRAYGGQRQVRPCGDAAFQPEEDQLRPYRVIARVEPQAGNVFENFADLRLRIIDQAAQAAQAV